MAEASLAITSFLVPRSHCEWLQAMRADVAHIESDYAALRWAIGCLIASLKWRAAAMLVLNGRISRPVLLLEWLMCFAPLTHMWIWSLSHASQPPDGPAELASEIYLAMAFATPGPVALLVALAVAMSRQSEAIRWVARSTAIASGAICLLQLVNMGAEDRLNLRWLSFDPATFVLLSVLPFIGCLHLVYLSKPQSNAVAA